MLGLIDHGLVGRHSLNSDNPKHLDDTYKIYFGLGQSLDFIHSPNVFKVSLAGIRLGHYLMRKFDSSFSDKRILDVGTGSGVHALLMRKLGNHDITATDISEHSIEQAKMHERMNFHQHAISFLTSDLFSSLPERQFQTIIFNPPGWRTPSASLTQRLKSIEQEGEMPIQSMFYGEEVIRRFLHDLPRYLSPTGTAVVGFNSMVGISDVLSKYNQSHQDTPPLAYRLMERHTLPLLYYSDHWRMISNALNKEFEHWSKQDMAAYSIDKNGEIFWSYEIIEFFHRTK
ncbi:methyltransferase [Pseudomonas veronii]|uniref:Methyltransferase n=1 Tax=Pseudomonas veronii TaxID=76761 RepID=A0A5M8EVZ9_PSEVE|nr:methyltransferase [Pseudomonas veronii]KAA6175700.1 methyltransferase [Pseudomonas veronii]KAA6180379.1 methyltransferase [Pseudomonas veronii]